ncbi:hypothetical protein MD484_g6625, partial [Candolleomyces efflorescens]
MSYTSPFLTPQPYIKKVNTLSSEGITIDDGIAGAVREAADFSTKYGSDFALVNDLKTALDQFNDRWTKALLDSRDAASTVSAYLQRFDQVFLAMIDDISSSKDAQDVVTEFNAFVEEEYPSKKYSLESTPGPKAAFEEIEGLVRPVTQESNHVVSVLQTAPTWEKAVEELKQNLPQVQQGVGGVRSALVSYAVKISN